MGFEGLGKASENAWFRVGERAVEIEYCTPAHHHVISIARNPLSFANPTSCAMTEGEETGFGWSLRETGTCRMGNDPQHFVTDPFGQNHGVPNLYACDASIFLNCTDETTTLSSLAFALRQSEYIVTRFKSG